MTSAQLLFLLIVFAVVCGLVGVGMMLFAPGALQTRLASFKSRPDDSQADRSRWTERVARLVRPLSRLSVPEDGWEKSPLRTRFMNAGWRSPSAPALYFASKTMLALCLPALAGIVLAFKPAPTASTNVLLLLLMASCGYYLPNMVLSRVVARRKREIFETIPDALDLLTVCVEAGLSLERAMVKVAGEIHIKSVTLAQELQLALMEMRAGFSKEKAMRNLALRIGLDDIDSLVAMLIQSERFGTSIGDALRVYSDNLRNKRRMIAEEAAAKIGLKLLFPLIFCIFPTLLMVLVGPAGIQLKQLFGSVLSNN